MRVHQNHHYTDRHEIYSARTENTSMVLLIIRPTLPTRPNCRKTLRDHNAKRCKIGSRRRQYALNRSIAQKNIGIHSLKHEIVVYINLVSSTMSATTASYTYHYIVHIDRRKFKVKLTQLCNPTAVKILNSRRKGSGVASIVSQNCFMSVRYTGRQMNR